MHRIAGEGHLADRFERVAYSALPASMTADMWNHNYLTSVNEVSAVDSPMPHWWHSDGPHAGMYGLAPNYGLSRFCRTRFQIERATLHSYGPDPHSCAVLCNFTTGCCTANFNQGWPKLAFSVLGTWTDAGAAGGGVVISAFAPLYGVIPPSPATNSLAVAVDVETLYPFGDEVNITCTVGSGSGDAGTGSVPLRIRVPAWAAATARVSVNGGAFAPATPDARGFYAVAGGCAAGRATKVVLDLRPAIRVEKGWGYNNSVAVVRGPLLFALPLEETFKPVLHYALEAYLYSVTTTAGSWNKALVLGGADDPASTMTFHRNGPPDGLLPWGSGGDGPAGSGGGHYPVSITAHVRTIAAWTYNDTLHAANAPPPSPVDCSSSATACGEMEEVELVPFGMTRLRVGAFPWVTG